MTPATDWNDLAAANGLDAVREGVGQAVPAVDPPEWPDPHLPGVAKTPEIPASVLPSWLGDMADAIAQSTQTPPALAVMSCLSVLATVLQGRFEVSPHGDGGGYVEPVPMWFIGAAVSGTRKTAVQHLALQPADRWEKLQRDRMRPEIARVNTQRAVSKSRIDTLKAAAGKKDSTQEQRELIRAEMQHEEENMPEEVRAPRLYTGNTTAERAQALLVEHGGRMAIHTDEAGQLGVMAGIYSNGQANIDVFLQSHSASPLHVDRATRSAHVERPVMTIGLLIQPGVLADVADNKRFRDSGLLARFLYVIPASNVGSRDVRRHIPIPPAVHGAYERNLFRLLEGWLERDKEPTTLPFSAAARERWYEFAEYVEHNQGEGGKFESISDWTSKLPGAVARIAALLQLAEVGLDALHVGDDAMRRAVALARLLIPHAQAAFGLLGTDSTDVDGAAIVKWVRAGHLSEFKRSECQKAMEGRFRNVERLIKALDRLQQQDVLREFKVRNKGAPPSTWYAVNPKALSTGASHSL